MTICDGCGGELRGGDLVKLEVEITDFTYPKQRDVTNLWKGDFCRRCKAKLSSRIGDIWQEVTTRVVAK